MYFASERQHIPKTLRNQKRPPQDTKTLPKQSPNVFCKDVTLLMLDYVNQELTTLIFSRVFMLIIVEI